MYQFTQLVIHHTDSPGTYRQIIRRIILAFPADTDSLDTDLEVPLKIIHIPVYFYVIQRIIISDSGIIGIPDLGINSARLILQNDIFICLSVLGHGSLLVFAEINVMNPVALF